MKIITENIGIFAALVMIILAVFVYNTFLKSSDYIEAPLPNPIGSEALETLSKLKQVSLNPTFLSSPNYNLLTDFSTAVPVQPVGRRNPFDAIGR